MAKIISNQNSDVAVLSSGMGFVAVKGDKLDSESVIEIPVPVVDASKPIQPQPVVTEPLRVLCGALSPSGRLLALADDHKQVTVWDCAQWKCLSQHNLKGKRANSITFAQKESKIVVADKSGDVYLFSAVKEEEGKEHQLILGHLSMLLDVLVSPCGKFLLTCDRDEKIRVSSFPNAYNIHNYCLGHEDFVTGMAFAGSEMLVSASGDGTIRVWDYLSGKTLGVATCFRDLGLDELPNEEDDRYANEYCYKKRTTPAVKSMRLAVIGGQTLIAVQVEGFLGFVVYGLSLDGSFTLLHQVKVEESIWDFQFNGTDRLHVLVTEKPFLRTWRLHDGECTQDGNVKLDMELKEFWEVSTRCTTSLFQELNKRKFDNMKEYMERKENRIEKCKKKDRPEKKGSSNGAAKKPRMEKEEKKA